MRPDAFPRRGDRRRGVLLLSLALALLVAVPIGTGVPGSHGGSARIVPVGSSMTVVARAFAPTVGTEDLGPVASSQPVMVEVGIGPAAVASLSSVVTLEYTPGSPLYHQYLTPGEIAAQFGAPATVRLAVDRYFAMYGLRVDFSADGLLAAVRGNASEVGEAFHTSFENFRSGGRAFFSHTTPAELPSSIPWYGALGLGNVTQIRPLAQLDALPPAGPTPDAGCAASYFLTPCQVWTAYNESPLLRAGTNGTGFRIGVVDAYDGTEPQGQLAADLRSFTKNNSIPYNPVHYLYPVPTTRNLNATSTGWALEESLDLEWSRAMAPGAPIDMTFAPDAGVGLYAAVDWLVAHHAVDVISLSWGEPDVGDYNTYAGPCSIGCNASTDGSYLLLHPVLEAAAAEGIGVFAASGDCGAAYGTNGVSTGYPSSDPFATGVGGTDLTLNASNGWAAETAWSGNDSGSTSPGCQNQGGSGGGFSPFPRPVWQAAPGVPASSATRGVPDVSIVGGTAVEIEYQGYSTGASGTSESCPMWAGIAAVGDQAAGAVLGDLSPSLYATARGPYANRTFHDILRGSNGYPAHSGWDPVTGIGSPNVGALVLHLVSARPSASPAVVTLHATPRIAPVGTPVAFYLNVTGDPSAMAWIDVSFGDGNASTSLAIRASHAYSVPGVYEAEAVAFDAAGNSSISAPIALVIGGGTALNVTLAVNNSSPVVGGAVALSVTVTGNPGPFLVDYAFGDGTYLNNATSLALNHTYGAAEAVCAAVVVRTNSSRPDGAVSNQVAVAVGGAAPRTCESGSAVSAVFGSSVVAGDLPGDLPLSVAASGGVPPYSVQYVTDDPYVRACTCGIFTRAGNHTVTAYVNDSLRDGAVVQLAVTLYPSLHGTFTATPTNGTAPLTVTFHAAALGGHRASAANTNWTFGDGTTATGATVVHTYSAGMYTAVADLSDIGAGNTSAAFVVHAFASASPGMYVGAVVVPAIRVPAGTLVTFSAAASGGTAPYQYVWSLGDNDSAFGATVLQTYSRLGCVGAGTCPLVIRVTALDATGHRANATLSLRPAIALRASALAFQDQFAPTNGTTPLLVNGLANVSGPNAATVAWWFGDGGNATGGSIAYRYLGPGNFTAEESVTSPVGDLLVRTHAVTVHGPVRTVPTLAGGPLVPNGTAPFDAAFSAAATGGAGAPYSYSWTFGDGGSATGANVSHVYVNAGHYTARVTASDRLGVPVTGSYPITVYELVPLILSVNATPPNATPAELLTAHAQAQVICGTLAPPGCSVVNATVGYLWINSSSGSIVTGTAQLPPPPAPAPLPPFSKQGFVNWTVAAPSQSGSYELYVESTNSRYGGNASLTIQVRPSSEGGAPRPGIVSWGVELLVVGVVVAAAAGVAGWGYVRSRARRSRPAPTERTAAAEPTTPSPHPEEEVGPPGG